jgi:hypothetical protein
MCVLMMSTAMSDTVTCSSLVTLVNARHNSSNVVNAFAMSSICYQLGYLITTAGGGVVVEVGLGFIFIYFKTLLFAVSQLSHLLRHYGSN